MPSAADVILKYVFPALGVITGNVMFSAPFRAVQSANRNGTLGSLNPTPWAMMTGNCLGWVAYSYIIRNFFVFLGNAPGFLLSVWLNLSAAKLQYNDHCAKEMRKSFVEFAHRNRSSIVVMEEGQGRSSQSSNGAKTITNPEQGVPGNSVVAAEAAADNKNGTGGGLGDLAKTILQVTTQEIDAPAPHEKVVLCVIAFWLVVVSIVCFLDTTKAIRQMIVGIVGNANLVFFYGAPLSTIFTVLKTRNSASIHICTMMANTFNGVFWSAYGWAVWDLYIAIPNALGAFLGGIQIVLVATFPRKEEEHNDDVDGVIDNVDAAVSEDSDEGCSSPPTAVKIENSSSTSQEEGDDNEKCR